MYVCTYVCMFVRMYIFIYVCIRMYVYMCVCMYACTYACMYVFMCVTYVYMNAYMYLRMYVCTYICTYVHTYLFCYQPSLFHILYLPEVGKISKSPNPFRDPVIKKSIITFPVLLIINSSSFLPVKTTFLKSITLLFNKNPTVEDSPVSRNLYSGPPNTTQIAVDFIFVSIPLVIVN